MDILVHLILIDVSNDSLINILIVYTTMNLKYLILFIGSTTFDISLKSVPEKISYKQSETSILSYTTNL